MRPSGKTCNQACRRTRYAEGAAWESVPVVVYVRDAEVNGSGISGKSEGGCEYGCAGEEADCLGYCRLERAAVRGVRNAVRGEALA